MNNTFECKRFGKLFSRDFRNIWPSFGLTMLIITLLPLAAWLLCMAMTPELTILPEARIGFIAFSVWLALIMAPSRLYKTCNLPKRGIYFAMLPASKLEKYLSMLICCLFVCPLLVLAGSIAFDYLLAVLPFGPYEQWLTQSGMPLFDGKSFGDMMAEGLSEAGISMHFWLTLMILSYFYNAAVFLFTNTIFKKHKVLKTMLWTMLISFLVQLVFTPCFMRGITDPEAVMANFSNPGALQGWYTGSLVFSIILTLVFFWWSAYRLKKMKY